MAKRFALIIESHNVVGQDLLPGAKLDADNWCAFLKSNLGGAWNENEIKRLSKPSSILVKAFLDAHKDEYIFLAFSGHGFEESKPYSNEHVVKICLNDSEQEVAIDSICPQRNCTAVFDCCRGVENAQGHIKIANESFAAGRSASFSATMDSGEYIAINSARSQGLVRETIRGLFSQKIADQITHAAVRMYSCSRNESAGEWEENPNDGGYYTTLLMQGAKSWWEEQRLRANYAIYTTKQAHDFACEAMKEINPQQHPEYSPDWQSYPFAIG